MSQATRGRYTDDQKRRIVYLASRRRSTTSLARFLKRFGVSDASFYTWRRQFPDAVMTNGHDTAPRQKTRKPRRIVTKYTNSEPATIKETLDVLRNRARGHINKMLTEVFEEELEKLAATEVGK